MTIILGDDFLNETVFSKNKMSNIYYFSINFFNWSPQYPGVIKRSQVDHLPKKRFLVDNFLKIPSQFFFKRSLVNQFSKIPR